MDSVQPRVHRPANSSHHISKNSRSCPGPTRFALPSLFASAVNTLIYVLVVRYIYFCQWQCYSTLSPLRPLTSPTQKEVWTRRSVSILFDTPAITCFHNMNRTHRSLTCIFKISKSAINDVDDLPAVEKSFRSSSFALLPSAVTPSRAPSNTFIASIRAALFEPLACFHIPYSQDKWPEVIITRVRDAVRCHLTFDQASIQAFLLIITTSITAGLAVSIQGPSPAYL